MPKPKGTHHVISASLTSDGAPAYFQADGSWTRYLEHATPIESVQECAHLLQRAEAQEKLVCDPYSFMVRVEGGKIEALSAREQIRSGGPSVRVRRPNP